MQSETSWSATDVLETSSKWAIQKAAESTGYLIGNNITDKIRRVSKMSPQNNLETSEEEILREEYLSPEPRHKIVILRLKKENYWWSEINTIII